MAGRKLILILTVFVTVAQQIEANCVCNEKGTDACACGGTVSPKPKHVKRPEFALPPLGDNCWCSKQMIQPASLPKPCSKHTKHPASCGCQTVVMSSSYTPSQANYPQTYVRDNTPPADPISISLAVQAGRAIQVPEAKLAYGFVRKPVNGQPKLYISTIKEENLYALANDVITLKKPLATQTKQIEEDYPEPDEEEPEPEEYQPFSLTYKQLGYGPEDFQNPTFMPLSASAKVAEAAATLFNGVKDSSSSDCGYKRGCITEMKNRKKFGSINCLVKHY